MYLSEGHVGGTTGLSPDFFHSGYPCHVPVHVRRNTYGSYQSLPVGYFMGAKSLPGLGCPTVTILHGENEVFQSNRNDFPKVTFTLYGI
jgi:hypothetical protein